MPKERIGLGHPSDQPFEMVVGWNRDQDVQVGIEVREPRTSDEPSTLVEVVYDSHSDIGEALLASLAGIGRSITDEGPDDNGDSYDVEFTADLLGRLAVEAVAASTPFGRGVWWHPSRAGINALIRTLRRARDQAFGKDE